MYTIRRVAEIHGEKVGLLQSWADKGWARITPAPGPGQARELSLVDVYILSIAIAVANGCHVPAEIANEISFGAAYLGHTFKRANERTWKETGTTEEEFFADYPSRRPPVPRLAVDDLDQAFRARDLGNPYWLYARTGSQIEGPTATYITDPTVHLVRKSEQDTLDSAGFFVCFNLTELLLYVDAALGMNARSNTRRLSVLEPG